jgi:HPt (histidine-containing phosphotransfer) domain-containing protein
MTKPPDEFLRFLEEQRSDYRRGLPEKLEQMERLVSGIGADATVDLAGLERLAHSMAGSGGTFGFAELGDAAKALELSVQKLKDSGDGATPAQREEVRRAISELKTKLPRA